MSQYGSYAYHPDDAKTDILDLFSHIRGYRYMSPAPINILVVGNSGSGKTTFCNRVNSLIPGLIPEGSLHDSRGQSDAGIIDIITSGRGAKADGIIWVIDVSKENAINDFQAVFKQAPQTHGRRLMFFFTHTDKARETQTWMLKHLNERETHGNRLYYAPLTNQADALADYNALMPVKHIYDLMSVRR